MTIAETEHALSSGLERPLPGVEWIVLREGRGVLIGPLASGDEAAIASWFAGLGSETRYARFFAWLERLDPRTRSVLASVDHLDHEAIAAVAPDGTTVGIARYIRSEGSTGAEVAVAVADEWRGRGIARTLLERLAERARAVGVERFTATCLASNHAVIHVLGRLGPIAIGASDAGIVDVRIELSEPCVDRAAAGRTVGIRGGWR